MELLEDPDGAPYPEEVQSFNRELANHVLGEFELKGIREDLVAALESVAIASIKRERGKA